MYRNLGSTDILMYDLVNLISALFLFAYNFSRISEKVTLLGNKSKTLLKFYKNQTGYTLLKNPVFYAYAETIIISVFSYAPVRFLTVKFGLLAKTGANYFGFIFFIPLFLLMICYFFRLNPLRQIDLITPSFPLALIFVKLACFCNGCCQGFECSWGMTNYFYLTGPKNEFPSQLLESGLGLALFVFLHLYRKKAKEGTMFPLYIITYSVTRFFSEFTRGEPNVFGILKTYHIICIIGVVLGIIEFVIALKYAEKIVSLFDRPSFTWYKEKEIVHHKK